MAPIVRGLIWGIIAFLIALLLVIVIAAILAAVTLTAAAAIFSHFGWILAVLVGILYFLKGSGMTTI